MVEVTISEADMPGEFEYVTFGDRLILNNSLTENRKSDIIARVRRMEGQTEPLKVERNA